MVELILEYICRFLALIIVLPLHEFAHAFVAVKNGDYTPKLYNRYTINPLAHFDLYGLVFFMFAGIGWAKPVPINPNNFKNYKRGCFFVSVAGVAMNYVIAFLTFPLLLLTVRYVPTFGYFTNVLICTLQLIYIFSLTFFVFNLIPVYPLDGFRVVDVFSKKRSNIYWFLRYKGIYLLYVLIGLSIFSNFSGLSMFDFFGRFMDTVTYYISYPITLFWGLIF